MMEENTEMSFFDKEKVCESRFHELDNCWHLHTDGTKSEILFTNDEDYLFGMNLMGLTADRFPMIKIFTFELMSNHLHIVMSGKLEECRSFFIFFKHRLKLYFGRHHRTVDLNKFNEKIIPISDLRTIRNEILYVNRNAYKVNSNHLPWSYPWGANMFFFNPGAVTQNPVPAYTISAQLRRKMFLSKDVEVSERLQVRRVAFQNGKCLDFQHGFQRASLNESLDCVTEQKWLILPTSYCCIYDAERFFQTPRDYFVRISRDFEAHSESAKRVGEIECIPDEEVYPAILVECKQKYGYQKISSLDLVQKKEIARTMHWKYHCSNSQIGRCLKLSSEVLDIMFPVAE